MNYRMIIHTIARLLIVEAILLVFPLAISLMYQENQYWAFIIPILILLAIGIPLSLLKLKRRNIHVKEGLVIVGLSWIIVSLFGSLPFIISGEIPSFIDAFFETVSGFTTTGASILKDVEAMSMGMLFWRSFTHWIGGMGVLVFVLAVLPDSDAKSIHILRAESPGPQVGKIVSKVRLTARILYIIYAVMTIIEVIFLVCGEMNLFEAVIHSFGSAGTGGFGLKNNSIEYYSTYSQIVIGIFMILFGINFNVFYLLLIGNFKQALKSEEAHWYFGIIAVAIITITINLFFSCEMYFNHFGLALKDSFFQVSSIITTTGYSSVDFDKWPIFSEVVLLLLMFIGSCAGSTGGGLKVSRFAILVKSVRRELRNLLHPHSITIVKFEGKVLEEETVKSVTSYFSLLVILFFASVLIISLDNKGFLTNFSAVAACINNIGPGLEIVGPTQNYSSFSALSKSVLIFAMLIGRLEIFPILILFNPKTWFKKY